VLLLQRDDGYRCLPYGSVSNAQINSRPQRAPLALTHPIGAAMMLLEMA